MLKLLERNIASVDERLIVLAPETTISHSFENVTADSEQHGVLLRQMQRLRGRIYLNDGALKPEQLTRDGRHETPEDAKAWHLLILDDERRISGCIWYLEHAKPSFDSMRIRHASLAHDPEWGSRLRSAVECDVVRANQERIHYAEVGGWAVAESSRLTDCLLLILSTYGLSQMLGGAFVVATATERHSSAPVLRRMGGARLKGADYEIPPYFDSNYDCEMELLRFDTRRPSARFAWLVGCLKEKFTMLPVFARGEARDAFSLDTFVPARTTFKQPRTALRVA